MIYVASSWRNGSLDGVFDCLDQWNIPYYDFRDSDAAFHWSAVMPGYRETGVTSQMLISSLRQSEECKRGFERDMKHLESAPAVLLVLPCGRSAHLELGWAVGHGKPTCIYFPAAYREGIEPELMYKMVDLVTDDISSCMRFLASEKAE